MYKNMSVSQSLKYRYTSVLIFLLPPPTVWVHYLLNTLLMGSSIKKYEISSFQEFLKMVNPPDPPQGPKPTKSQFKSMFQLSPNPPPASPSDTSTCPSPTPSNVSLLVAASDE